MNRREEYITVWIGGIILPSLPTEIQHHIGNHCNISPNYILYTVFTIRHPSFFFSLFFFFTREPVQCLPAERHFLSEETQYIHLVWCLLKTANKSMDRSMLLILSKQSNCHLQPFPNLSVLTEMKSIYFFTIRIKCTLHHTGREGGSQHHRLSFPCVSNEWCM